MATFKDVIGLYFQGAAAGQSSGQGNLKIKGNVLIHYFTPIMERSGDKYILNMTRYSIVTGRLQKQLKEMVPEEQLLIVTGVSEGYKGSLRDYIKDKEG